MCCKFVKNSCLFVLLVAIAGCDRSGNSGRVEPRGGVNSTPVTYNAPDPGATVHTLQGEAVQDLIAQPEALAGFASVAPGSAHRVEGRLTGLKPCFLRLHCSKFDAKHGKVTAQEATGGLVEDGDGYRFQIEMKVPEKPGKYLMELVYVEFDPADPQKVTSHVIAEEDCEVLQ